MQQSTKYSFFWG